jgi:hypothetical protein
MPATEEDKAKLLAYLSERVAPVEGDALSREAAKAIAQRVATSAEKAPVGEKGRELEWVTPGLRTQLDEVAETRGEDWHTWLPTELDERLGGGWMDLTADELVKRVDDLVGLLVLPVGLMEEEAERTVTELMDWVVAEGLEEALGEYSEEELEEMWNEATEGIG